ncbi:MAG: helix-turn-helix transcriptional regulator [Filimonas sp.]|nr:helix-turn-helix transcriptional regulator [Filimonas sp.]
MKNNSGSSLLTRNKLGEIAAADQQGQQYMEVVKAFARLTYGSVYVIDYTDMSFEYVSENPLFLCGYSAEEVLQMGYDFYFRHVPEKDLELLSIINEAGFNFYESVPVEERKLYSIAYDFHLVNKENKTTLINHKLTPLFLTESGKMWKSMCIVSLSHHQTAGNIRIHKQGASDIWEFSLDKKKWYKSEKPMLTEKETEVLRLHAQGLSISQIADRMFVAPDTVKYYRRRIFERLEVNSVVEALSYAVNSKLI